MKHALSTQDYIESLKTVLLLKKTGFSAICTIFDGLKHVSPLIFFRRKSTKVPISILVPYPLFPARYRYVFIPLVLSWMFTAGPPEQGPAGGASGPATGTSGSTGSGGAR